MFSYFAAAISSSSVARSVKTSPAKSHRHRQLSRGSSSKSTTNQHQQQQQQQQQRPRSILRSSRRTATDKQHRAHRSRSSASSPLPLDFKYSPSNSEASSTCTSPTHSCSTDATKNVRFVICTAPVSHSSPLKASIVDQAHHHKLNTNTSKSSRTRTSNKPKMGLNKLLPIRGSLRSSGDTHSNKANKHSSSSLATNNSSSSSSNSNKAAATATVVANKRVDFVDTKQERCIAPTPSSSSSSSSSSSGVSSASSTTSETPSTEHVIAVHDAASFPGPSTATAIYSAPLSSSHHHNSTQQHTTIAHNNNNNYHQANKVAPKAIISPDGDIDVIRDSSQYQQQHQPPMPRRCYSMRASTSSSAAPRCDTQYVSQQQQQHQLPIYHQQYQRQPQQYQVQPQHQRSSYRETTPSSTHPSMPTYFPQQLQAHSKSHQVSDQK